MKNDLDLQIKASDDGADYVELNDGTKGSEPLLSIVGVQESQEVAIAAKLFSGFMSKQQLRDLITKLQAMERAL
jgi:hypothetical protein